MKNRLLSLGIYLLSSGLGIYSFLYPLVIPLFQPRGSTGPRAAVATPLMLMLLLALCLLVLLYEVQAETVNTRLIALLGILVAINSVLRFIEIAIPGPGGFSPIFLLIILTGYIYGGHFGFLMGALTMLVSALITGGVGPWLPGQMFCAGWVGMSAPACRPLVAAISGQGRQRELLVLALFGAAWGIGYGAIMNLWSWPFLIGPGDMYATGAHNAQQMLQRYSAYYLLTSLVWDLAAAFGNVLLVWLFGASLLRALRRFQQRFNFEYHPAQSAATTVGNNTP
jgi:energy-coupling factor transport system substrate-specific component